MRTAILVARVVSCSLKMFLIPNSSPCLLLSPCTPSKYLPQRLNFMIRTCSKRSLPCLQTSIVADLHLLLLVHLAGVYELLNGPSPEQAVDRNISRLSEPVCPVHGLQVVRRICVWNVNTTRFETCHRELTPIWIYVNNMLRIGRTSRVWSRTEDDDLVGSREVQTSPSSHR